MTPAIWMMGTLALLFSAFVLLFSEKALRDQRQSHSMESQRMAEIFTMLLAQSRETQDSTTKIIATVSDTAAQMAEQAQKNCQEMLTHLSSTISLLVSPPPAPDSPQTPTLDQPPPWETLRHPQEVREYQENGGAAPPAGWSTSPQVLRQMRNLPEDAPGPITDPLMEGEFDPSP